jgi:hypothetical protein
MLSAKSLCVRANCVATIFLNLACLGGSEAAEPLPIVQASASNFEPGFAPEGAIDRDRFAVKEGALWKSAAGAAEVQWTADLGAPLAMGAILQVLGDHGTTLAAPVDYVWESSLDGAEWRSLESTQRAGDRRIYRVHRLPENITARYLRITFRNAKSQPPSMREVELYADREAVIDFPAWFAAVNSFGIPTVDACELWFALVHKCAGWEDAPAQFIWHGHLTEDFARAEPAPVCMFFTGSFVDWCEVSPATWRVAAALLEDGSIPMWAACGGAQAFGILSDGVNDVEWDCPKCRDPRNPKTPIYGHIGALDPTGATKCGDYSNNIYERGPTLVRLVQPDPVFVGLDEEFLVPQYHCGQLEYLPLGWDLIVTKGRGGKTLMQCMKKRDTCIYAAQFHIEMDGTPESSVKIMSNFLDRARQWTSSHPRTLTAAAQRKP